MELAGANELGAEMISRHEWHFTIGRVLAAEASRQGLSRSAFVRLLGYTNLQKGCRVLDRLLHDADKPAALRRAGRTLGLNDEVLDAALRATDLERQAEAASQQQRRDDELRAIFRPHIIIESDRRPQNMVGAMTYFAFKHIRLPAAVSEGLRSGQLQWVAAEVARHYRSKMGKLSSWGNITGYTFHDTFETCIRLDVEGKVLQISHAEPQTPQITLSVKGRKIPLSIFGLSER
jgi:hypothetical protein